MEADHSYTVNYVAGRLYVNPSEKGAYAAIAADAIERGEERVLAEIEVTSRSRVAVSAFFVSEKEDWNSIKITKLKFHKTRGWELDGEIKLNHFDSRNLRDLLNVLAALDMRDAPKAKIDLGGAKIEALSMLLASDRGPELIRELSQSPLLEQDIYAVAAKRRSLTEFQRLLSKNISEPEWQAFFEANP